MLTYSSIVNLVYFLRYFEDNVENYIPYLRLTVIKCDKFLNKLFEGSIVLIQFRKPVKYELGR